MDTPLTLVTWPNYLVPATFEQFETEFKVRLAVETIPSAVDLIERVHRGNPVPDVIVPPDYAVRELAAEDGLHALDHSQVPNLQHLDARFRAGRTHDPDMRVSITKDWGTTGFLYRHDKISESPRSWADFWGLAEKVSGHVTVVDGPGEVIGLALMMRGKSYNADDEESLAGARRDLLALKPRLLAFDSGYASRLESGEAWLALGWNGDAAALLVKGVPITYVIPTEGGQIWEDDWAIPAGAPHLDAAYTFLNFMLRPEIAAQEALATGFVTGNRAALDLLPPEISRSPIIYPPEEALKRLEAGMPHTPEGAARREKLWQEVRG